MSTVDLELLLPSQNEADFDESAFVPAVYNNTYYAEVMEDERCLIEWQATKLDNDIRKHLGGMGIERFGIHFDAGSGPSVHRLLALEKYSDAIDVADYLPQNLAEIQGWVNGTDPNAHDWKPFAREILAAEGLYVTEETVALREQAVKNKIRSYNPLDFKEPTEEMLKYKAPFVTSFFVADSATGDKQIFADMTKNAFNIVAVGGLFVAAYLGGCKEYAVGDKWIKSADLSQHDIQVVFEECGAKDITIERFNTPSLAEEGFDHIFAVTAKAQ